MWEKILCENMQRMFLCFCIEAIHIIAEGSGERTEDGDFKELQYMDKVVHALYKEWFEPLYLESGMVNSLERYFWLFERIRNSLKEIHFTYDDESESSDNIDKKGLSAVSAKLNALTSDSR